MYKYVKLFVFIITRAVALLVFGVWSTFWALLKILLPRSLFYQNVQGKTVLITGSASGLGRELAVLLAKRKARIVSWDVNEKENQVTADAIRSKGGECTPYTVDITYSDIVHETAQQVEADLGKIDIIINSAGIIGDILPIEESSDFTIRKVFQVNVFPLFWITKAFLPGMIKRECGQIVTIGSVSGQTGWHQAIDYSSSKFAASGFCEALRRQIKLAGHKGIDVTLICPSFIRTPMTSKDKLKAYPMVDMKTAAKDIMENILTKTPVHTYPWVNKLLPLMQLLLTRETLDLGYFYLIQGLKILE